MNQSRHNLILLTDGYKLSHFAQYPPKTTSVFSYFASRGVADNGQFAGLPHLVMFYGLQAIMQEYLEGAVVTMDDIDEAEAVATMYFGRPGLFNRAGWERIVNVHGGRLPLRIKAVTEGTVIDGNNALITVENLDPELFWLTNYVETLLVQVWYPCTVATLSWNIRHLILSHLEHSGDPGLIDYKLHDFGFRGVSSVETAGIGGAAHLVNFRGTDTIQALVHAARHYDGINIGHSIPAAEHSTITSWGRTGERAAYRNMMQSYPEGPVAVVSDSYDIYNACENLWGGELRQEVLERKGTVIVRPDSGYPPKVVCEVLDILGSKFGYDLNAKGFKVLHPNVRVIQGDGVDYDMIDDILLAMRERGWSADNVAFGMGGALLQKLNRDDLKFAFKCSSATVEGYHVDVCKTPVTDRGKRSKAGRLALIKDDDGSYHTVRESDTELNELIEVFKNGEVTRRHSFEEVRRRALIATPPNIAQLA